MRPNRSLAAVLFVMSVGYLAGAFLISEPGAEYVAIGPRAFPVAVGIGLVACSLWIGLSGKELGNVLPIDWRVAVISAIVFLAYMSVLEPVGYVLATVAFITTESRLLGSRAWRRDLIVSVFITVSIYAVFNLILGIRLPVGLSG